MVYRHYRHARRSAARALGAVCVATTTLAGCAGSNVLNGHTAPTLSGNASAAASPSSSVLGSAATSGSGTSGFGTQTPQVATGSGTQAQQVTTGSPTQTQPSTTPPSRPYRPNSVILRIFPPNVSPLCVWVAAGGSAPGFKIQWLVEQPLCFTGLDASAQSSLVVMTPEGAPEPVSLTWVPRTRIWEASLFPVPGQGAEATLGDYAFRMTTTIPGSGSSGPAVGVINTSGRFTVIPATQPRAEVVSASLAGGTEISLPVGSQLSVRFADFPSLSMVYVSLYGPGPSPGQAGYAPLLTDLPGVQADQYGEGVAIWDIPSGATAGRYGIWIDPRPAGCTSNPCMAFDITA